MPEPKMWARDAVAPERGLGGGRDTRLISQRLDATGMGIGKDLRRQATDDPESVDIGALRNGLRQTSGTELRHTTEAARKVAYSQPVAAQRLREELESILANPRYSGSAVSNARKALGYLPKERGTRTRPHTGAEGLRQLAMQRPESVDPDELAAYLSDGDRTEVRHATEAARKVAYTRASAPPLVEPLEAIANGSQYASKVRESARTALDYLDEPGTTGSGTTSSGTTGSGTTSSGTTGSGTGRSAGENTVVFDGEESEVDADRDDPETVVFGGNGGTTGASGGTNEDRESAVKFCPNCGTDLRRFDSVNFCSECGMEL